MCSGQVKSGLLERFPVVRLDNRCRLDGFSQEIATPTDASRGAYGRPSSSRIARTTIDPPIMVAPRIRMAERIGEIHVFHVTLTETWSEEINLVRIWVPTSDVTTAPTPHQKIARADIRGGMRAPFVSEE